MDDPLAPLKPGDRIGKALNVARLNTLAQLAQDAMAGKFLRGGPGILTKTGVSGTTIGSRRPVRRGRRVLPLEARLYDVSGTLTLKVEPSTIIGEMPTIDGTSLAAGTPPELTVPPLGTRYLVVNVSHTPTVDGGFMFNVFSSVAVTITLDSTSPNSANLFSTSGNYKFLLATIVDGVKTAQVGYGPITGEICDTLTGEGKGLLNLQWAGYQP